MIRLLLYFALVAGAASGFAWMADTPGSLTVVWLGKETRTSVLVAAIVLLVAFAAIVLAVWLGVLTWTAPKKFARRMESRKRRIGQAAVRRGIFAAGAGDREAAFKAGLIAKRNVPDEPLALLLEAQSAQLNEDPIASRQAFERMLANPEMTELGLRGLHIEASKAGQQEAAKQFAERAIAANPGLSWPTTALFDAYSRDGDWRPALKVLGLAKQHRHLPKGEADRRRALILTALAAEIEDTQQGKALAYALEATALIPAFLPATIIAARILAAQGNVARATKLIAQCWRTDPHPSLALIYAHARTGDSPRERLSRVKTLASSAPASLESDVAVAVAAIEAKEWDTARSALNPHLGNAPQARVCRLMARIEAAQNRDIGRAREWLARAANATPDPVWVAPDGSVSHEWHPVALSSGALGVYEWKVPARSVASGSFDIAAEIRALDSSPAGPALDNAADTLTDIEDAPSGGPKREAADTVSPADAPVAASFQAATASTATPPNEARALTVTAPPLKTDDPLPAINLVPVPVSMVNAAEAQKTETRRPNIFIPNRAPDDPGPRAQEAENGSTPLSRYRSPS